jgi:hypothetical protein
VYVPNRSGPTGQVSQDQRAGGHASVLPMPGTTALQAGECLPGASNGSSQSNGATRSTQSPSGPGSQNRVRQQQQAANGSTKGAVMYYIGGGIVTLIVIIIVLMLIF